MKRIISQLKARFTANAFIIDDYLCRPDIAGERFAKALHASRGYYARERGRVIDPALVHDSWKGNLASIEEYFTGRMDEDFLSNEIIKGTMLFTNKVAHRAEIDELLPLMDSGVIGKIVSKDLCRQLLSGKSERNSVINSVHHLYHLMRFEQATGRKLAAIKNVVEFGGGYGNMARIFRNMEPLETYRIIDLLLFSCIQYVFLCVAAGEENVDVCNGPGNGESLFSLYPLPFLDYAKKIRGELFLSTWALSESTRAAYDFVAGCDWFGAANLLIAYNDQWMPWNDGELASTLKREGWRVVQEPIRFLPHSHYLFATR